MRSKFYILLFFVVSLSLIVWFPKPVEVHAQSYQPFDPILITNNDMFGPTGYNFPGTGKKDSPYLIQGYVIIDSTRPLIQIFNTDVYFEIRNNYLDGMRAASFGIELSNVVNGNISNNQILNCGRGIRLWRCNDNNSIHNNIIANHVVGIQAPTSSHTLVQGNRILNNSLYGIELSSYSELNTLVENNISNCRYGIHFRRDRNETVTNNRIWNCSAGFYLYGSNYNEIRDNEIYNTSEGISMGGQNNIVSKNHIHHNEEGINHYGGRFNVFSGNTIDHHTSNGINIKPACYNLTITKNVIRKNGRAIQIVNSDNHIMTKNRISENTGGISLFYSVDNCFVANNTFSNNAGTGISISGHQVIPDGACENNTVEWNDFINNTDGSINQAFEQRSNPNHPNIFDYNYWSDWTTPDDFPPFWIVDIPYDIDGNAHNADPHPRTTPLSFVLRMDLKLSGEFDFLLKEDIHLQLAALLTDKDTGKPVSGANVTFKIYNPDGQIIIQDVLREEVVGTGVYLNKTMYKMKDLILPKGIYLVIAEAQLFYHPVVIDMIQFHVDPPGTTKGSSTTSLVVLGTVIGSCMVILYLFRRKTFTRYSILFSKKE